VQELALYTLGYQRPATGRYFLQAEAELAGAVPALHMHLHDTQQGKNDIHHLADALLKSMSQDTQASENSRLVMINNWALGVQGSLVLIWPGELGGRVLPLPTGNCNLKYILSKKQMTWPAVLFGTWPFAYEDVMNMLADVFLPRPGPVGDQRVQ